MRKCNEVDERRQQPANIKMDSILNSNKLEGAIQALNGKILKEYILYVK